MLAAEYFITSPPKDFLPIKRHKFDKTPTNLVYGDHGEVLAWGFDSANNDEEKNCFKSAYARRHSAAIDSFSHLNSASLEELEKWISDYMNCYCTSIIDYIVRNEDTATKDLNVTWYLTTPGRWTKPIQAEFRMLVDDVLKQVLQSSKVLADFSESEASSEFLANYLQLKESTWAITCDIGGATCDTALAIIERVDDVLEPQVFPISGVDSFDGGVGAVDLDFSTLITNALRRCQTDLLLPAISVFGTELIDRAEWQRVRHAFDGSADIILTADRCLGSWKDPMGEVSVDGSTISVSRYLDFPTYIRRQVPRYWLFNANPI